MQKAATLKLCTGMRTDETLTKTVTNRLTRSWQTRLWLEMSKSSTAFSSQSIACIGEERRERGRESAWRQSCRPLQVVRRSRHQGDPAVYVTLTLLLKDSNLRCYLGCQSFQPLNSGVPAVVADQNALTASVLDQCETRQQFNKLLTELYDYPRYSCPRRHGRRCSLRPFLPFHMQPLYCACMHACMLHYLYSATATS